MWIRAKNAPYAGVMPSVETSDHRSGRARFSYPVFLDLDGVRCLVVGGGRIGARKAEGLAAAGARVRLVATDVSDHVDRDRFDEVVEEAFERRHFDGVRLVITATGDVATDQAIADAARSAGIWTNAADQPVDCEFILPAIVRSGRVTGAISTDGASPALAKYLRDRLGELLDERIAVVADRLAAERQAIQTSGGSTEDVDWSPRLAELLADPDAPPAERPPTPEH